MIFVTLGNQNFSFKRLIKSIDRLVKTDVINEEIIVQCGYTIYDSDSLKLISFMDKDSFMESISKARFIISHAGTGSIISCLKKNKKVIVAPRRKIYGEHIDDHQLEIAKTFENKNLIIGLKEDFSDLPEKILSLNTIKLDQFVSNNHNFNIDLIKLIDSI
ncbi:PssE/Cps14G family polysaccharide biosynthesis glycosyltransferase [Maribacter ulvicola]|uniref:UDP-N-acetylglucosamine transferase subunit ALG13 n=1 Tax=Maribacter ulvicola TaxID=228959 RepID=A0A1N6PJA5_9FLAO|nr:PssE/Cps14G family polysaccharide biosynthesis glycosyltransferase [Maribacter ulvicola]SIQ04444.1 UDP-N-acetylglucosamine transferase subunit ALG13 [Maribacter ulvicola]